MAVHITVVINKTQVFAPILGLKPLRQLVSTPRVSGSVPTARIRFPCSKALRDHELLIIQCMATTTETKPPNPTHVQHCYNIVFGAVRVM